MKELREDAVIVVHRHAGGLETPKAQRSTTEKVHRHAGGLEKQQAAT